MIFPIRLVYVCGAISAKTEPERDANIERGKAAGMRVWGLGAMPVVPHMNSLGVHDAGVTAEAIYLGDLALLGRCDALLAMRGWGSSFGCNLEMAWARWSSLPVFDEDDEGPGPDAWERLEHWIRGGAGHFLDRRRDGA